MGHLINPAGFRVGYFSNWSDLWSTSNNLVYAEILHNTILLRRAMMPLFENFVTDRYSILYSHFTIEVCDLTKLKLKMYFYDGIVEQKLAHMSQLLNRFRIKKAKTHRRLLRRFWKVKSIRVMRSRFLRLWRYYDYLTARQLIFFFIYFLYMGISSLSPGSFTNVLRYYFRVLSVEWEALTKKNYSMSVFSFVKYYIKLLVFKGFDAESAGSRRLHSPETTSNFAIFFQALDEATCFWRKHQNFLYLSAAKGKVSIKKFLINF